jgi:beta-glucanase (GH16 family)
MRTRNRDRINLWLVLALVAGLLMAVPVTAGAVPGAPGAVFDDFEDGDAADWSFFGGAGAGGGGGVLADRPAEGSFYLSTGWGGGGSASVFYGGFFRNLDNASQLTLPADPWFNVWVLNQSDATVDGYTLEITIREDLDGNGWTDGAEDSFRLDTAFSSGAFDDEWTLISAPVSSFADQFTGGDGTFNGAVDEIVVVVSGVSGANGSTVEVDFDQFVFTSGGPLAFDAVLFDDMEHGDPFGNGWFSFGGDVGGGGIAPNATDLPPALGGAFSLETGWGSGGVPGFFGGFGRTFPVDLSGTDHFNFWINPDAGQGYTLEINLQDDDNGNDLAGPGDDDEFQYDCVVGAAGPCAVAGGGWQFVSIPLADFYDDNSFFTGGNGVLDPTPASRGGNGRLINVVIAVIGTSGSDATFRTDYWAFSRGPLAFPSGGPQIVDDFESGVAPGSPCPAGGLPLGFCTFNGAGSSVAITTTGTPPAPVPAGGSPNSVLQMDVDVTSFAGFIHGFTNAAGDTWLTQDWSLREGFSLWLHGTGSGTSLFIDLLDNRNPGSTGDDAERWTVAFTDDFTGWQQLEFPFSAFTRKEIGNGAPNDGFGLVEVHGWALGTLGTGGPRSYYVDDAAVYGVAEPPPLAVNFAVNNNPIEEGTTGEVRVKLNRPMGSSDPTEVSVDFTTEPAIATPGEEYTPTSGTLTFTNGGATEQSFSIETFDDTKFEGDERIVLRLSNPSEGLKLGPLFQASAYVADNDPYDPDLLDDFERGAFLWDGDGLVEFDTVPVADRPGQDSVEHALSVEAVGGGSGYDAMAAAIAADLAALLPSADKKDAKRIEKAIEEIEKALDPDGWVNGLLLDEKDGKKVFDRFRKAAHELEKAAKKGGPAGIGEAVDGLVDMAARLAYDAMDVAALNGGDDKKLAKAEDDIAKAESYRLRGDADKAIEHYRKAWHDATKSVKKVDGMTLGSLEHDFALGEDWSDIESLSFWYKGTGSGEDVTITLKENRASDPGPSGWSLVWSDEFDEAAGTPPNPENWTHEIGDVTPDGKYGWGNEELQYYTDDPANASADGDGNLVITLREADGSLECYYGPCEYTSARLLTTHKAEFAYGRIESRLRVPSAGDDFRGLWPAFWSLGTDIDRNPWPGAGEIDIMEWVGRLPNEIFGTIHGPGYSGGASFGGIYDFAEPVSDDFHTFTVEWEPNLITWYVDGIQYHQAEPSDVTGPWVFDKPFFLLLNFAIGGNFGGPVGEDVQFPQEYLVDYVRVYQGPDTAERFEATFPDDSTDWTLVEVPIADFTRSGEQPAGAPDDGLTLNEVWGYGFEVPYPAAGTHLFDMVRKVPFPPPTEVTVTNLDDSGEGSLREALATVADGGLVDFDPALAGGTIVLTSGQLEVDDSVTIDASAVPGIVVSGGNASRVFRIAAGATVAMNDLVVADGVAAPQGGGIQNFGTLSLDRVVVRDNIVDSPAPPNFEYGGGGIYNGSGATLNLTDSTVADNESLNQPAGGIYGFFGSTINITRSTVSGNQSGDVAGGLRSLGNATIVNSTFSANESSAWHGGGIFHTDGSLTVTNSTFAGNIAPAGTASGILVATFGAPADATLTNNVLQGTGGAVACAIEGGGAATITSGGGNVIGDGSCNPGAADLSFTDALLGPLTANGGPTLTHALSAGSPAIDFADGAACPATDQRGVARPQGAGCDAGSFELEP